MAPLTRAREEESPLLGSGNDDVKPQERHPKKEHAINGELLEAVQTSGIFEDSKDFVDMPMRHDPEVVLQAFQAWSRLGGCRRR